MNMYMWQSRIEIEYYSVACFERIKLSDALEIRDEIIFDFNPGLPHMRVGNTLQLK